MKWHCDGGACNCKHIPLVMSAVCRVDPLPHNYRRSEACRSTAWCTSLGPML